MTQTWDCNIQAARMHWHAATHRPGEQGQSEREKEIVGERGGVLELEISIVYGYEEWLMPYVPDLCSTVCCQPNCIS